MATDVRIDRDMTALSQRMGEFFRPGRPSGMRVVGLIFAGLILLALIPMSTDPNGPWGKFSQLVLLGVLLPGITAVFGYILGRESAKEVPPDKARLDEAMDILDEALRVRERVAMMEHALRAVAIERQESSDIGNAPGIGGRPDAV